MEYCFGCVVLFEMDDEKFIEKIRLSREITSILKSNDLESYVEWKRKNSDLDIHESATRKLYSPYFDYSEYELYGITFYDFLNAYRGDEQAIDHLCLLILEAIVERKKIEKTGASQLQSLKKVIPDTAVQYLILQISEVICSKQIFLNHSYIMLLREVFKGPYISKNKNVFLRARQVFVAEKIAENQDLSNREISKITGVDHSTISRWKKDPNFQSCVELYLTEVVNNAKSYKRQTDVFSFDEQFSEAFKPNYDVFAWISWRYLNQVDT